MLSEFNITVKEAREYCKERTLDELAEHFGITRKEVKKICNKYGLYWKRVYRKKEKPFPREEMIRHLAQKFTYEQIGTVFGISRQRVEQIIKEA